MRLNAEFDTDDIYKKEILEKYIGLRLVNKNCCRYILDDVQHEELEDIAVMPVAVVPDTADGYFSLVLDAGFSEHMDEEVEDLLDFARERASLNFPLRLRNIREYAMDRDKENEKCEESPADELIFFADTEGFVEGASCIFYPEFMEKAAERVGGSFFFFIISQSEVMLIKDNGDISLEFVEDLAAPGYKEPKAALPHTVFYYDAGKKLFGRGDTIKGYSYAN